MSGLRKLAKIIFFLATCGLLLNGLGHLDLGSWGVNSEWREKIEMVLQAKEILKEAVEVIPWGKALSARSTEIQVAAATSGLVVILIELLSSLLRFLIGIAVLAVVVGLVSFTSLPWSPNALPTSTAAADRSVSVHPLAGSHSRTVMARSSWSAPTPSQMNSQPLSSVRSSLMLYS
jgi:hypothetical protein